MNLRRSFLLGCALLGITSAMAHARADEKADALLKKVSQAASSIQSLTADVTVTNVIRQGRQGMNMTQKGSLKFKRPNLFRVTLGPPQSQTLVSNGKIFSMLLPNNKYTQSPAGQKLPNMLPVGILFDTPILNNLLDESGATLRYLGTTHLGDEAYRILEVHATQQSVEMTLKCYVAPNNLVTRSETTMKAGANSMRVTTAFTDIKINPRLTAAAFQFTPPKSAKLYTPPTEQDATASLVPVGKAAPAFSLPTPAGGHVSLADAGKGKKAILVNFWFYG